MLPFYLGKIIIHNLLPLRSLAAKKFSELQTISEGKKEMRKGRMFTTAEQAGERKGSQRVAEWWDPWRRQGR